MQLTFILLLLGNIKSILSVEVSPNSPDASINVELSNDPRGVNKVVNNEWYLDQDNGNGNGIFYDWGLVTALDVQKYSFVAGASDSTLTFTLDGRCGPGECDAYFGFSIGGDQYAVYAINMDGGYEATLQGGTRQGSSMYAYPACGAASIEVGVDIDPLMAAPMGAYNQQRIRDALVGGVGQSANWYKINKLNQNPYFPVTFTLVNDDLTGTFTVSFTGQSQSFTCIYNSAVPTDTEIEVFFSPDDAQDEQIFVSSLTFESSCGGVTAGQECESSSDCGACMKCCKVNKICEYPNRS